MKPASSAAIDLINDPFFAALKEYVIDFTGLAYYEGKEEIFADRVRKRREATGLTNNQSYLNFLQGPQGSRELDALAVELTIGETYFFRHEEHFQALRDVVIPNLVEKNQPTRHLRIWSAGCSTGAEAYSLSMLLKRDLGPLLAGWQATILGTDINRAFLSQAIEGRFEEWALRGVSQEIRTACFSKKGNSWYVAPQYKEGVSFEYHNLIKNPFPSLLQNLAAFDLILCRNAMIYFSRPTNERLSLQFHRTLVPGGWLVVGYAELDRDLFKAFQPVQISATTLFQKDRSAAPARTPVEAFRPPVFETFVIPRVNLEDKPPNAAPESKEDALASIRELADRGLWDEALQRCEDRMTKDRLDPALHYYGALVHEQMGHWDEAENLLRRALYLDRHHVLVHYHLGLLLAKRAQKDQAVKSFENALELLKHHPPTDAIVHSDGLLVSDLCSLAQMQLDVLKGSLVP